MAGYDIDRMAAKLRRLGGGYEVIHTSPGLEIGVYVLVATKPDDQTPHVYDEVYYVLSGRAEIEIEGQRGPIEPGEAVFVAAGDDHRFHGYQELALLVVFNGPESASE